MAHTASIPAPPASAGVGSDPSFLSQHVRQRLVRRFGSPDYRPPMLPRVALDLFELTREPEVRMSEVERLLSSDPLLAASVVRVARSPLFATGGKDSESLRDAILRLGLTTLRDILFLVAMNAHVFALPSYGQHLRRLVLHSTATGHVCRVVSRHVGLASENAFLCGLLHDAGAVAALGVVSEDAWPIGRIPVEVALDAILDVHADAGRRVAELWNLPKEISQVLGQHHGPAKGEVVQPLAAVVRIAEEIVQELGFGFTDEHFGGGGWAKVCLGLGVADLPRIAHEAKRVLEKMPTSP
ncbi:MAG: HDOD domain-containing protein [Polyangiaceae bacterium]